MYRLLFFYVFAISSVYGQDCKGIKKKTHKDVGATVYLAIPKGRTFKSPDPDELDVLIARKLISSTDTLYDLTIYRGIDIKPKKAVLKGVSLIFEDGSQIERPEQDIETIKISRQLTLKAQYQLKPEEVVQLSQKTLVKVKLIKKELSIYPKMAQSFRQKAGCLLQLL